MGLQRIRMLHTMAITDHIAQVEPQLVHRFGPSATEWCATLPARVAELSTRWQLRVGSPFEAGASSLVLRCTTAAGIPAVLKLSPDTTLMGAQADMLEHLAPSGRAPAVLAWEPRIAAMVMEEVVPGTVADDLPVDELIPLWADLMRQLHRLPRPARELPELRDRFDEAFQRIGKNLSDPLVNARIGATTWNRSIERCRRLLDSQDTRVVLHGDLHPGNALDGGPARGLVAIDPKLCVGDPCFDAVDLVAMAAGGEGVDARCERMANACGLDGDRLHAWARVVAPMFVIGHLRNNGPEAALEELLELCH